MTQALTVLGLESSCDDTAAAIVRVTPDARPRILSSVVHGQDALHANFGGVVPEIARAGEEIGCMLAISFHATTDEVRDNIPARGFLVLAFSEFCPNLKA